MPCLLAFGAVLGLVIVLVVLLAVESKYPED